MAEPELITAQLQALRVRLPASLFDEVADGLQETYLAKLQHYAEPTVAAEAAVAEFGDADTITRAACLTSDWRQVASLLLATGPALGAIWAVTLLSRQPWLLSLPTPARLAYGAALLTVVALLLRGRVENHAYEKGRRQVLLAAAVLVILDSLMCVALLSSATAMGGPALLALTVSVLRVVLVGAASVKHLGFPHVRA